MLKYIVGLGFLLSLVLGATGAYAGACDSIEDPLIPNEVCMEAKGELGFATTKSELSVNGGKFACADSLITPGEWVCYKDVKSVRGITYAAEFGDCRAGEPLCHGPGKLSAENCRQSHQQSRELI